jgi:DNA-binding transcriptional ArsR family regulator
MDVFEAIAEPHRREILMLLRHGQMTAGAIAQHFPISRPAISRHLRHLREAGLVEVHSSGREREYRLAVGQLDPVRAWLRGFEPRLPESVVDAFETEVYRARREYREARPDVDATREEIA